MLIKVNKAARQVWMGLIVVVSGLGAVPACVAADVAGYVAGRMDIVDGDTLRIGAQRLRLFGVDAPERAQSCTTAEGHIWPCGAWVTAQVRQRYQGAYARCTELAQDRYGRSVVRCEVAGGDLGHWLVREGLAFAYRKYSRRYVAVETQAVAARRGVHGSDVQHPAAFRAARRQAAARQAAPKGDCAIKGNISAKGARIFHMPGQEHYARTVIRQTKGERWFCSVDEAQAAGWRKARR